MARLENIDALKEDYSRIPVDNLTALEKLEPSIPKSDEYEELNHEVNNLYKQFFKPEPNIVVGNYIKAEDLRYFVLCFHAEIEDYLEKLALNILNNAEKKWDKRSSFDCVLASLTLYFYREKEQNKKDVLSGDEVNEVKQALVFALMGKRKKFPEIKESIKKIIEWRKEYVTEKNHGIKWSNIKYMLKPLGVPLAEFIKLDSQFSMKLKNIGQMRGKFAHKSNADIITENTSQDEFTNVMKYLSLFDAWLIRCNIISK